MCKSQNWNVIHRVFQNAMLTPDELHNWLMLRGLKIDFGPFQNRPIGPCEHNRKDGFSIPQSFPQVAGHLGG
jgi:hypothetical protein